MNTVSINNQTDIDSLLSHIEIEANRGDEESLRATGAKIRNQAEKIADRRQDQLDNIKEKIKGAHPNACLSFLGNVFKVFDILLKPLSAVTGGQLKLELGKALEMLKRAQVTGKFLGINIEGKEIQNALGELKKILQSDMNRLKTEQDLDENQNQQIINILDEIHQGFESTVNS